MTVSQILNTKGRNVITASSDQTVLAVSRVLVDKRIGAVVVVDSRGKIEGIASERDFVKAIAAQGAKALERPVRELMTTDGRITGAVLAVDGETRRVVARRAVVLATGGFGGSVERLNEYVRPALKHAVAFAGARGEGMTVARAAGAAVEDDHAQPAFWTPVSETGWLAGGRGAISIRSSARPPTAAARRISRPVPSWSTISRKTAR